MKTIIYDKDTNAIGLVNPLSVITGYNSSSSFCATIDTANASSAQVLRAATTGKSIYVTDIIISTSGALEIKLQDTDATAVMKQIYLGANGTFNHSFATPLKLTASKGLNVIASGAGSISCTVSGFVA